jgi:hypothetical protein
MSIHKDYSKSAGDFYVYTYHATISSISKNLLQPIQINNLNGGIFYGKNLSR